MDELIKQFVSASIALEKAKADLMAKMKADNVSVIEIPEGGYVRYWPAMVKENIAWFQKPKDPQETGE